MAQTTVLVLHPLNQEPTQVGQESPGKVGIVLKVAAVPFLSPEKGFSGRLKK